MSIRVALHHKTEYLFDRLVSLAPHTVRLRPAPHTRTPVHHYSLKIEPEEHFLNWQQDPFGNYLARFVFPEKTRKLSITVDLVAEIVTINPFDFFVEEYADQFPTAYEPQLRRELAPYFEIREDGIDCPFLSAQGQALGIGHDLRGDIGGQIFVERALHILTLLRSHRTGGCADGRKGDDPPRDTAEHRQILGVHA